MKVDVNEKFVICSGVDLPRFTPSDFERIAKEYKRKTVVIDDINLSSHLGTLREIFKDNFFVQLGFTSTSEEVVTIEGEKDVLKKLSFESKEEAFSKLKEVYLSEQSNHWFKYIPKRLHQENLMYLQKELDLAKQITLTDSKNQVVAMVMMYNSNYYTGQAIDQIGWIWITRNLELDLRKDAHYKISKWIKENSFNSFYQAGIHIENDRSQNFFRKLGFKATCAHISRR